MMENPLFPLKSIDTAWLNPSFTTWAMDMILAFVCGLGIFLLLLSRLQGNPSFPPPRKKGKFRKHVKVKKVLYKRRKKNGTLKGSGNHLKTLEEIQKLILLLQSLLGKLWNKDSPPQLLHEDAPGEMFLQGPAGAHKTPHQHFEDLSTTLSPPLPEEPPQLSLEEHLAQEETQSQILAQNLSPSVSQGQTLASTSYSFPNLPHSPSTQSKTGRTTCTNSEKSFIPNEDQHLESPLQNQQKWKKALFSEIQKTQEVINQPTLNLPQKSWAQQISNSASTVARDSTSQDHQKRIEQHIQKKIISDGKQQLSPPCRFLSQEQMQHQDKCHEKSQCQKKNKPGPSQPTQSPVAGRGIHKMESKYSERLSTMGSVIFKRDFPSKGLEPELQRQSVDLSWSSGSTSGKVQNDTNGSDSYLRRTRKGVSENDLSTGPDKNILEKIMQDHMGRKLVQVKEGMIPVCVHGPWLAANYALPNMHTKPIHLASSKDQQSYVNTFQKLSFLDPGTHLKLETHMSSWVRHGWSGCLCLNKHLTPV